MITKYLQTSYDGTQWFLNIFQCGKGGLDKFYINIYITHCKEFNINLLFHQAIYKNETKYKLDIIT